MIISFVQALKFWVYFQVCDSMKETERLGGRKWQTPQAFF